MSNLTFNFSNLVISHAQQWVNGYNEGKAAALQQINSLLVVALVGLLVAQIAPILRKYAKTEQQQLAVSFAYDVGLALSFAAVALMLALNFVTARVGGLL